jgi:hypothetical protein
MRNGQKMTTMTRDEALADADREIVRLEAEGRGLFYIAELYGVPTQRHNSRWAYLGGEFSHGTLTLGYLRNALADIAQRIAHAEKEEAAKQAHSITAGDQQVCDLRDRTPDRGRDMGDTSQRSFRVRDRGVHEGGEGQAA